MHFLILLFILCLPAPIISTELTHQEEQLLLFAIVGNLKQLTTLLNQGANIDIQDDSQETAFIKAARSTSACSRTIELLLARGANSALQNRDGDTALHITIKRHRHINYIKPLLAAYANIGIQDNEGNTPLHSLKLQYEESNNSCEKNRYKAIGKLLVAASIEQEKLKKLVPHIIEKLQEYLPEECVVIILSYLPTVLTLLQPTHNTTVIKKRQNNLCIIT